MRLATRVLVLQVEAQQRLVAEQQRGVAGERLGDAQPLLLAAGEQSDRAIGERGRADLRHKFGHPRPIGGTADRQAEAVTVDTERDEVAAAQRGAHRQHLLLRDVADASVAPVDGVAEELRRAGVERLHPENYPQQTRLARPVRPEHGNELSGPNDEVKPPPQRAGAEPESTALDLEDGIGHVRAASTASMLSVIHDR